MLLEAISGKFSPVEKIISINLTHNCNYACWYCFDRKNPNKGNFINFSYLKLFFDKYLDYFKNNSEQVNIILMGGEPTLHPEINDIIKFLQDLQIIKKITLITNLSDSLENYKNYLQNSKLEITFSYHFNKFSNENEEKAIWLKKNNFKISIEFMVDNKIELSFLEQKYNYLSSHTFNINKKQLYGISYKEDMKAFSIYNSKRFVKLIYNDSEKVIDINSLRNLKFNPFKGMYCDSFKLIWNIDSNNTIKQQCDNKYYNIFDESLEKFFLSSTNNICTENRCICWVELRKYR